MAVKLDPKVVDTLLDKLASDDTFRKLFEREPDTALAEVGHKPKPGETAGRCLKVTKLADKATIKKARAELRKFLTAELGLQPHRLEA